MRVDEFQELLYLTHACEAARDWCRGKRPRTAWAKCQEPIWLWWGLEFLTTKPEKKVHTASLGQAVLAYELLYNWRRDFNDHLARYLTESAAAWTDMIRGRYAPLEFERECDVTLQALRRKLKGVDQTSQ